MATIEIEYSYLSTASLKAGWLSGSLTDYSECIYKKINKKISELPGKDGGMYVTSAEQFASNKIKNLNEKAKTFESLKTKIDTFLTNTKEADENVAKTIKSTAQSYVGERSAWQGFCDFLWNAVCVDFVNWIPFGEVIKNIANHVWTGVKSAAEKVCDWFKYGGGKYIWNIVSSVISIGAAIIGIVTGVAAIIAGGTALAIAAAIAGVVGGIIAIVNSIIKLCNNGKALDSEDPAVAEYVGSISGVSDALGKYDMGGKTANKVWKGVGTGVNVADTVCGVVQVTNGVANLAGVKDAATGKITSYKFDKPTVTGNVKELVGYDANASGLRKYDKVFKFKLHDPTKTWYEDTAEHVDGIKFFTDIAQNSPKAKKAIDITAKTIMWTETGRDSIDYITKISNQELKFNSATETFKSMGKIGYSVIEPVSIAGGFTGIGDVYDVTAKPIRKGYGVIDSFFAKPAVAE